MNFQFPYMNILDLKKKEKDQALIELGMVMKKKEAIIIELESFVTKRDEYIKQMEVSQGSLSISSIQQQREYLEYLNYQIAKLEGQLNKINQEIAAKESELLSKQTEEKTWNHLRDKSFDRFIQKQKKIEQDLMDEMSAIRHFHQRLSI